MIKALLISNIKLRRIIVHGVSIFLFHSSFCSYVYSQGEKNRGAYSNQLSPLEYGHKTSRTLETISTFLSHQDKEIINSLIHNKEYPGIIMDIGSGHAVYAQEIAFQAKRADSLLRVHAFSIRDFYKGSFFATGNNLYGVASKLMETNEKYEIPKVVSNQLQQSQLAKVYPTLREIYFFEPFDFSPISLFSSPEEILPTLKDLKDKLQIAREKIIHSWENETLPFKYHVGYVEIYLKENPRFKGDVILDVYGAFHYSKDRKSILDLYFRHLKPGGKAIIVFENNDLLSDKNGKTLFNLKTEQPLSVYEKLNEFYPTLFNSKDVLSGSYIPSKSTVLTLKKPPQASDNLWDYVEMDLIKINSVYLGHITRPSRIMEKDRSVIMEHVSLFCPKIKELQGFENVFFLPKLP